MLIICATNGLHLVQLFDLWRSRSGVADQLFGLWRSRSGVADPIPKYLQVGLVRSPECCRSLKGGCL